MAYDEELAQRVRDAFAARHIHIEEKRMMGGLCIMVDGKMCVGVEQERLMVRLDPAIYETALRRPGCKPMDFTGKPMRGFVFVDLDAIGTDKKLGDWIALALDYNPRAKSSKRTLRSQPRKRKS